MEHLNDGSRTREAEADSHFTKPVDRSGLQRLVGAEPPGRRD